MTMAPFRHDAGAFCGSAMILAAGRGERMRPLTDSVPKALLPVGGIPLIQWHVERLRAAGFRDLVVNHAHLGEQIERELGDGAQFAVSIRYSREASALETAGGIRFALDLLPLPVFPVVNADVFSDFDYRRLNDVVARLAATPWLDAHIVLVDNPEHHPGGDFTLSGGLVGDGPGERFTFAGIGVYRRSLFEGLVHGEPAKLAPLLRAAIARGALSGERFDGRWVDVGTPERLAALDAALRGEAARANF